jgi:hypothetical protein
MDKALKDKLREEAMTDHVRRLDHHMGLLMEVKMIREYAGTHTGAPEQKPFVKKTVIRHTEAA